jgi:predicted nucleic acid-binding protein
MAGNLFSLVDPGVPFPDPIIIDANVIIARMLGSYPSQNRGDLERANAFFRALLSRGQQSILTPTAYSEVIHASIKATYLAARREYQAALSAHYGRPHGFSWLDLYKMTPAILQQRTFELEQLRQQLVASNLVILSPEDLGPIPSGQRYDTELLALVGRFGLDTSDATILMESTRVGITDIVTFDQDMQRALDAFDIYTWL